MTEKSQTKLAILHPGAMGISVAASAQNNGCQVFWASESRSKKTIDRAEKYGLIDAGSLQNCCDQCQILISVCPPHAAEDLANQVIQTGFSGIFVDANAISPQRSIAISQKMENAGIQFVDAGIVGGPAWKPDSTFLYLSGKLASTIADCFAAGPLERKIISDEIGKASAMKMCYAAWTKGSTALLSTIVGSANALGVWENLKSQWDHDWENLSSQAVNRCRRVTAKAWRFAGEMEEISATFEKAGLPGEFHAGAAELYHRMADFKDADETPELDDVLNAITKK